MDTLLKQYEMLENAGCRFIAIKPKSKQPIGKWANPSDPASLPIGSIRRCTIGIR